MKTEHFVVSDVGRVRENNEDSSLALPEASLYVVADGMGGHVGGKQASQTAVDTLRERLDGGGGSVAPDGIRDAIREANRRILRRAAAEPGLRGMGTTLVVLLLPSDGRGFLAHVGDSRAYRFRAGKIEQLTADHSIVGEMVRRRDLSESDAERHPYRHVLTRALGAEDDVDPEVVEIEAASGDAYVLCSDGVSGMLDRATFERIVREHADAPERLARALVEAANDHGGKDNATVIVVRCIG